MSNVPVSVLKSRPQRRPRCSGARAEAPQSPRGTYPNEGLRILHGHGQRRDRSLCLRAEFEQGKGRLAADLPIDISQEYLQHVVVEFSESLPTLEVIPVRADFTQPVAIPDPKCSPRRTLVYFPGSTIGNFEPVAAAAFLTRLARLAGPGGAVLVGADLKKSPDILEAAYDDQDGVTAAFNLNLLVRANNLWKSLRNLLRGPDNGLLNSGG